MPEIQDLFKSGELERLVLKDNVLLTKSAEQYYEGMQYIVGDEGLMQIEPRPDLHYTWIDTNNDDVVLSNTMPTYLLSAVVSKELKPDDTIIEVAFKVTKQNALPQNIYVDIYANGTLIKTIMETLPKVISDKYPIVVSTNIDSNISDGSVIQVKVRDGITNQVTLNGSDFPNILRIRKTKAIRFIDDVDIMKLKAYSISNELFNHNDTTIQFNVFEYNDNVIYDINEDYFELAKNGIVSIDLQLNLSTHSNNTKLFIWIEKEVAGDWIAIDGEQAYLELIRRTEGVHTLNFSVNATEGLKIRFRASTIGANCRIKRVEHTTGDGTALMVPSAKITIKQNL